MKFGFGIRNSLSVAALLLATAGLVRAETTEPVTPSSKFTRVDSEGFNNPRALQVAIVTYASDGIYGDATVDLVSALHLADKEYYEDLNGRFAAYDAVLYELVAPQGTVVSSERVAKGGLSSAQRSMRSVLELDFQLDEIDYTKDNFVHADMSPKELMATMTERGESVYSTFWNVIKASQRESARDPLGIQALIKFGLAVSSGKGHPMKVMLAYDFADLDRMVAMTGNDATTTLIGGRNERAIEVLVEQLEAGQERLGIFYGAAHMPDFEERLNALGFIATKTVWLDAWVL